MQERPMFYIIDGHALAYRQYFALPVAKFSTRSGEPTNATFGFTRTLLDILQKEKPKYIAVSFDRGLSGRDELYSEYKGTREKMDDDLRRQIERIHQVVETFNMPILALDGYEADDVIGTVVPQVEEQGANIRIVTGDRDILQLLTEHVSVQIPRRNEADVVYDLAMFREEYGLEPWQLVELKALMGDTSDNIPGVKGIGEKTATTLLQAYESVDGIYAHIDEIKGANQKKLIEGRDMAYLSRDLATIRRSVPIAIKMELCLAEDFDVSKVDALFGELEFRSLRDRLPQAAKTSQMTLFGDSVTIEAAPKERPEPVAQTVIVRDEATLADLVTRLNVAQGITWDVETTSTDQMAAVLVGIALAVDGETGYYIPVGHKNGDQLPLQTVVEALRPALTNPDIPKYAHNATYDLVVMQRYGIDVSPVGFDTMVAEWMRDPVSKFLGLKNLARQVFDVHMTEISLLIGTGKKQITMDEVEIDDAGPYAADDAALTHRLVEYLRPQLEENNMLDLFNTLEIPLIPVVASMERAGVVLDKYHLGEVSEKLAGELAELEQKIFAESGGYGPFNINSPKQLNDVLFGKIGLPTAGIPKTTHGYSTAAHVLENLSEQYADRYPILGLIMEYREVAKLKGTYVDALPLLVNPQTGRLHTSYNQTGTSTGRLSSSDPNLQNIPIRTERGRDVRRAFIAPEGMQLLSVDYSQIELRVLAHYSGDETLLQAFAQGQDIHAATAATVFGIPLESVSYEQRSFAKRVNFGLIYGMGAFRLARDSDLTLTQAEDFIDTYFKRLPGVKRYLEDSKQRARTPEGLSTLFGRRRTFPILIESAMPDARSNRNVVAGEERVAINMPIQGTAADIMKRAMIDLHTALTERKMRARMILQVHDELVLEVPEADVQETRDLMVRMMESAFKLDAPLKANAQAGQNWRDMQPVK